MKIAVRIDDITPDMDWRRFEDYKAILDRYQVKPLIGVVPDNHDKDLNYENNPDKPHDFWQYIRELQSQGWVIAMHGYRHLYTTQRGGLFPLNNFSEFAGLDYDTQKTMLSEGKRILQEKGIQTDIFMAPAHSYDRNTLKALKDMGFNRLTDGFGKSPYSWRGMTFYPISFQLSASLKGKSGTTTMVIHTNTMSDEDRKRHNDYFENSGSVQWISYDEYLAQEPVPRRVIGRIGEFWCAKIKYWLVKGKTKA